MIPPNKLTIGGVQYNIELGNTSFYVSEYDSSTGITYGKYGIPDVDSKEPLIKILVEVVGTVTTTTITHAYDTWANRATATYTAIAEGK